MPPSHRGGCLRPSRDIADFGCLCDVHPVPTFRVILLPGSVLPAGPAYGSLLSALGPDVDAVAKELEVYATSEPPPDCTLDLDLEFGGLLRAVASRDWDSFQLVGSPAAERPRSRSQPLSATLDQPLAAGDGVGRQMMGLEQGDLARDWRTPTQWF